MADKSHIEWTQATWNPVTGCSKVSQGCKHCYALRDWARLSANPGTVYFGRAFTDICCHPERLDQPLRWTKPRRIFVNSMSDLFHEDVPDAFIDRVLAVMALATEHTFQVLTKRPERMHAYLADPVRKNRLLAQAGTIRCPTSWGGDWGGKPKRPDTYGLLASILNRWPLPNVWLGVSVEDQATADERIPLLLQTPAAVRWLSMEPLLGSVDLRSLDRGNLYWLNALTGRTHIAHDGGMPDAADLPGVNWVVVGGESGPQARPMHPAWVRSLRDQCQAVGVPFFFKQWGEWIPYEPDAQPPFFYSQHGDLLDGHALPDPDDRDPHWDMDGGADWLFRRVGKKLAGRMLDGRTWDDYPEVSDAA